MELQDFLSKLSLPQDFTRRGFLKATSVMAAIGMMNQARAASGVRPYIVLETAKGILICDPNLCVACHRCELACTEFNEGKADPRLARIKITRNVMFGHAGTNVYPPTKGIWATASSFRTPAASAPIRRRAPTPVRRAPSWSTRRRVPAASTRKSASAATSAKRPARGA